MIKMAFLINESSLSYMLLTYLLGYPSEITQETHQHDRLHTINAGIWSRYTTAMPTAMHRGSISGSIPVTAIPSHMVVPCRVDFTPPQSSNPPLTLPESVIHSPFRPQTTYTPRSPRNLLSPFYPLTIGVSANTYPQTPQSVSIWSPRGCNLIPLSNFDSFSSSLSSHVSSFRPSMNNTWDPNRGTVGYSSFEKVPPWRHESGNGHSAHS